MTDCSLKTGGRVALVVSVAANIFLVAFVLGRLTVGQPPAAAPANFRGMMRPPAGHMMPPPMFGPSDLFGPDEVRADETRMREHFDKMDSLRKAFASQLQAGPVSKDDVLKHFADIDQALVNVKKEAQERAAEKISSMSDDDRSHLAQTLLHRGQGPFGNGKPDNIPPVGPKAP
ncbi:MAG: hypothetical protein PHE27_07995 [Alphaproteobacteria bacterium]|nr:hypothetical protein [Alphaproteobacteria bacterium]